MNFLQSITEKAINSVTKSLNTINEALKGSRKVTALNLIPALTQYITTENSYDTITKSLNFGSSTLSRQHDKLKPILFSKLFHNFIDTIHKPLLQKLNIHSTTYIIDGSGLTLDTRIKYKLQSHGILMSVMYDYNLQMPIDICINTYYQEQKCVYLSHLKFIFINII